MKKAIKTILGIIVFSSLFGMSYAFGTKDISPILRDYLFFGGGVLVSCCHNKLEFKKCDVSLKL